MRSEAPGYADGMRCDVPINLLSLHGRVLAVVTKEPTVSQREIGHRLSITQNAAHRVVKDLVHSGVLVATKQGRSNRYQVDGTRTIAGTSSSVGDFAALLQRH